MEKSRIGVLVLLGVVAMIAGLAACQNISVSCSPLDFACPEEGDSCTGDFVSDGLNNNTKDCAKDKHCCAFPLLCVKGKCVDNTRNADCNTTEDCKKSSVLSPGSFACINNKCIVQMSFNDSCREDDHCSGKQECMCGDHKCKKEKNEIGRCAALKIDDECSDDRNVYSCGANGKCVGGKCKAVHAVGEDCEKDDDCDIYTICNKGKCIDQFSVKKGEACSSMYSYLVCENGLYCDAKEGVCKEARKKERILCSKDEDCSSYGEGSTCSECDYEFGGFYCSEPMGAQDLQISQCVVELQALYKCARENYCAPVYSLSVDTCAQSHCVAETNDFFACSQNCEDQKHVYGAKCVASVLLRYCPLIPTWLRIVIAFSILLAILIIVLIIFAIFRTIKKKNGYSAVPEK